MKRINWFSIGLTYLALLYVLLFIIPAAVAAPPYDITANFNAPTTGGPVGGYNFFIDDCASTGATGAPIGTVVSGQTFAGTITADGTYLMCVRAFNSTGENPDPGQVATVEINDLPLPGTIQNLGIQVTCPDSNCVIDITISP